MVTKEELSERKHLYKDEAWLKEKYEDELLTIYDIARICGVSDETIRRWIHKFGGVKMRTQAESLRLRGTLKGEKHPMCGKRRPDTAKMNRDRKGMFKGVRNPNYGNYKYPILTNKSWLRQKWVDEKLTCEEIAGIVGCSNVTVLLWVHRHCLKRERVIKRRKPRYKELSDDKWLRRKYLKEGNSIYQISDELGCSPVTVSLWLRKHGIEERHEPPKGENHPLWKGGVGWWDYGGFYIPRKEALERDNYTCRICGAKENNHPSREELEVHHIIPISEGGDHSLENLITLCNKCHVEVHFGRLKI